MNNSMANLKSDIKRYIVTDEITNIRQKIDMFLTNYSLWVIISYRLGRWIRMEFKLPIVKQVMKIVTKIIHNFLCLITGINIPFETHIGPGLYIGHTGMLIINHHATIGSNCNIGVGVVIGQAGRGTNVGSPVIGNNVFIGVGSKILGKIKVGENAAIGANAVVVKDVPPNATVVGIPAKVINYFGSKDFVKL